MLKLHIDKKEYFNEITNEFLTVPETTLLLEHSLHSISEWESIWKRPFLSKEKMTDQQVRDYVRCMLLTDVPYSDLIIANITPQEESKIVEYIDKPMSATWFNNENDKPKSRKIITAEVIYYWMIAQNIPFECEYWHFNKLMTLIRVCNAENAPKKKMSRAEEAKSRAALNRARRMRSGSKG